MKVDTLRLLIISFVLVTLFAALVVPPGQPRYRVEERVQAMQAYTLSPSAATKAALDDEFALLHHHEASVGLLLPSVLLLDAAVIYFF